jgi:hypothetical protein
MKPHPSSRLAFIFCVIALLTFVSCSLVLVSCKKSNPIGPGHPEQQDTTSHEIEWKIWKFGPAGISANWFRDVFAISDTDVWVVGYVEMTRHDSLGNRLPPINAVHWNGREWSEMSILSKSYSGRITYSNLLSVHAFSGVDIWFFSLQSCIHWDGVKFTPYYVNATKGGIIRGWGSSSTDIYITGIDGSLTHFDGKKFELIETGTTCYLDDVYGTPDGKMVWVGGYQYWDLNHVFLQFSGGKFTSLERTDKMRGAPNIWASKDSLYAQVGWGVYIQSIRDTNKWRLLGWYDTMYPLGWLRRMRGSADNNVFLVGDFGTIIHYNGKSWKMSEFFDLNRSLTFFSVSVLQSKVYVVGVDASNQAVIYEGTMR